MCNFEYLQVIIAFFSKTVWYHRIFHENCVIEEHEIWFAYSIHMGEYTKKIQVPRSHSIGEKCDAIL